MGGSLAGANRQLCTDICFFFSSGLFYLGPRFRSFSYWRKTQAQGHGRSFFRWSAGGIGESCLPNSRLTGPERRSVFGVKDNQDEGELGGEENVGRTLRVQRKEKSSHGTSWNPMVMFKKKKIIQVKNREPGRGKNIGQQNRKNRKEPTPRIERQ